MNTSNNNNLSQENEQQQTTSTINRIIEIPVQHLPNPSPQKQQLKQESPRNTINFANTTPITQQTTFEDFPAAGTSLFGSHRPRLLHPNTDEFFHSFDQDPFFTDFSTNPFTKLTAAQRHKSPSHSPYFDRKPTQQQQHPQGTSLPFVYQPSTEVSHQQQQQQQQQQPVAPQPPTQPLQQQQRIEIPVNIQKDTQPTQLSESPQKSVKTEIKIDTSDNKAPESLTESFQNFKKQQQQQQQQASRSDSPAKTKQPFDRYKQEEKNRSPSPKQQKKQQTEMGNLQSNQQQQQQQQQRPQQPQKPSSFVNAAAEAANFQTQSGQKTVKMPQEKLDEIALKLDELDRSVSVFNGKRTDKEYLKLDEYLTKCLLELDAIERGDDRINQLRRSLIQNTHKISEKLEAKGEEFEKKLKEAATQKQSESDSVTESKSNESQKPKEEVTS